MPQHRSLNPWIVWGSECVMSGSFLLCGCMYASSIWTHFIMIVFLKTAVCFWCRRESPAGFSSSGPVSHGDACKSLPNLTHDPHCYRPTISQCHFDFFHICSYIKQRSHLLQCSLCWDADEAWHFICWVLQSSGTMTSSRGLVVLDSSKLIKKHNLAIYTRSTGVFSSAHSALASQFMQTRSNFVTLWTLIWKRT